MIDDELARAASRPLRLEVTAERPAWLRFAERVQAIAQTGLAYAKDPYDRERYEELRGIAVQMAAAASAARERRSGWPSPPGLGYPTPKVDVRAVVFRGDELLLVRERRSGRWTVPRRLGRRGRHARRGRRTRDARGERLPRARRQAPGLLDKARHAHPPSVDYTYKVLIGCRLEGGEPVTSHEIDAVGFFARTRTPISTSTARPRVRSSWPGPTTTTRRDRRTSTRPAADWGAWAAKPPRSEEGKCSPFS